MAFQFSESSLAITYRNRFSDDNDPTLADFEEWDNSLANAWNKALNEVLPEFPDVDGSNQVTRSNIMLLAAFSSGGNRRAMVRSACAYFLRLVEVGIQI